MNIITVSGSLTRDAEMRTAEQSQRTFANFTLAVPKRFRSARLDVPDSDYFQCRAWGIPADQIGTFGVKGKRVLITGRMESRRFKDGQNIQRDIMELIVDSCEFLDPVEAGREALSA